MPVYAVPVTVDENGVERPAVEPGGEADDGAYHYHYRGGTVYVASRVQVDAYEDHEDVTVVDDASGAAAGTEEYPAPSASSADDSDDSSDSDDEDDDE